MNSWAQLEAYVAILPAVAGDGSGCKKCFSKHAPDQPHVASSITYQDWFRGIYGRDPTWMDAMAHCQLEVRKAWCAKLRAVGVDPTSTDTTGARSDE